MHNLTNSKKIVVMAGSLLMAALFVSGILQSFLFENYARAQMQSGSYKILFDAVDTGGVRSTSSSFTDEDTVGEQATGVSTSSSYTMNAGYQHMYDSYIAIQFTTGATSTSVSGLNGGISTTSLTWTVITDNPAGYILTAVAATSPALKGSGGASISDYVPAGAAPDFAFSVSSSAAAFGFTVEGTDTVSRFKDNGSTCATGSSNTTDKCWDGFSTSAKDIAQSTTANHPDGTATTVKLRTEIGSNKIQDSGSYNASITVTAVTL